MKGLFLIKILLVAPERELRHRIREEIRRYGYRTLESENGEGALRLFEISHPDLIVLDMATDRCCGRDILIHIREMDERVPIIAIGPYDAGEEQLPVYEAGAEEVLAPGFSEKILLKKINVFLRCSGRLDPQEIRLGDLRLNTETYQIFWQGQPLELTAKEFELLKVLMKNKGRILTRLQLLDRIWGYDYGGEERVVDAHIKNLRHKLPAPVIRTVKGIGYTIDNGAAGEAEP